MLASRSVAPATIASVPAELNSNRSGSRLVVTRSSVAQVEARMERLSLSNSPSAPRNEGRAGGSGHSCARDDAHHALVGLRRTRRARRGLAMNCAASSSTSASASTHAGFHLAPFAVDGVELAREVDGALGSSVSRHSMPRSCRPVGQQR